MAIRFTAAFGLALVVALAGCSGEKSGSEASPAKALEEMEAVFDAPSEAPIDRFTYSNYNDIRVTNAGLALNINFDEKIIDGVAILDLEYLNRDATFVVLDTNDLIIKSIETNSNGTWHTTDYMLGEDDPVLGSRLEIALPEKSEQLRITYATNPEAEGLQWLSPEQTAGKKYPFLFSQNQPIFARAMAPLQDTPAVRMTYTATVTTSPDLIALMSANQDTGPRDGEYTFSMPQPIPSYLIAIAVGDLDFKAINDHIGVYAEKYIVDAAAAEFADTPAMEDATAALYGPYRWGRYDMLVLPPSFPFGGMENPKLSFLTPTLIAGDKSLTNVVAHELAHSWSGNLVTNATWRDAWLNEGFTSYVENRVMESLYGEGRAVMERALDLDRLREEVADTERVELTQLKLPDDLNHPDDAFSQVAYVKGMFFLKFLENRFGRDTFDAFLKQYFDHFAFQSVITEDFLAYVEDHLWANAPEAVTKAELYEWVYGQGLPDTIEAPVSDAFEKVSAVQSQWLAGDIAAGDIMTNAWTTQEWLYFINSLPERLAQSHFTDLDSAFNLSASKNAEIAFAWYMQTIKGGYAPAMAPLDKFLMRVGRGKFIYRLYQALIDAGKGDWAAEVYARARPGYHPIAQRRIDAIFEEAS
jgi:leukotriene-A4 hydrolase